MQHTNGLKPVLRGSLGAREADRRRRAERIESCERPAPASSGEVPKQIILRNAVTLPTNMKDMKLHLIIVAILGLVLQWGLAPSAMAQTAPPPKLGIALSGGGAKGLAHIGVLKYWKKMASFLTTLPAPAWAALWVACIPSVTHPPN